MQFLNVYDTSLIVIGMHTFQLQVLFNKIYYTITYVADVIDKGKAPYYQAIFV